MKPGFLFKKDFSRSSLKRHILNGLFWVFLLLVWQMAAGVVDNDLICPSPVLVIEQMADQISSPAFGTAVLETGIRALGAWGLSFVLGFVSAAVSFRFPLAAGIFGRLVSLIQTVPNVSWIILLLFWTGRQQTILLVGFFLVFPVVFRGIYEEFTELERQWGDLWTVYPQPFWIRLKMECLPLMQASISAACRNGIAMSFKACVMAEILASAAAGIGRNIQTSRLDINVAGVLGWTFWLIALSLAVEWLADRLLSLFYDR